MTAVVAAQVPEQVPIGMLDDIVELAAVPLDIVPGLPGPGDLTEGLANGLLDGFFATLSEALAAAAVRVNEMVFGYLTSSTTVDLGGGWFGGDSNGLLATTSAIGLVMVLAFFFAAIIRGLLRGEYSAITRAALVDVPLAVVGTVGLVTFASMLLAITDAATGAMLEQAAGDLGASSLEVFGSPEAVATGGLLSGLLVIVYVVAALLTWLWLFLRAALIYFVIVAAPLGIATRAFPPAAVFARRTIEMAIALIVSKFFLAIALAVGAQAFNESSGDGDLAGMAVGAASMCLAAFMPAVVLKLIPIAEGATASSGVERAPIRAAATVAGLGVAAATVGAAGAGGAATVGGFAGPASPQPPAPGAGYGPSGPSGPSGPAGPAGGASTGGGAPGPGTVPGRPTTGDGGGPAVSVASIGGGGVDRVSGTSSRPSSGTSFADLGGRS